MRELLVKVSEFLGLYKYAMKLDNRWQMHRQNKAFARYGLETLSAAEAAANDMGCNLLSDRCLGPTGKRDSFPSIATSIQACMLPNAARLS